MEENVYTRNVITEKDLTTSMRSWFKYFNVDVLDKTTYTKNLESVVYKIFDHIKDAEINIEDGKIILTKSYGDGYLTVYAYSKQTNNKEFYNLLKTYVLGEL